ncbi:MAG: hypothetical protein ACYTCV_07270 [Planctomycetota bacterium]|jgi:hypothetical protein
MEKKHKQMLLFICSLGVILALAVIVVVYHLESGRNTKNTRSAPQKLNTSKNELAETAPKINETNKTRSIQEPPIIAADLMEVDMPPEIEHEIIANSERMALLAESRMKSIEWKKAGKTLWGSERWMKSPEYYQSLTTEQLAKECFERTIFGHEMTIFNDPAFGFIRLEIHHNGFAELFKRDDMWEGILDTYYQCSSNIDAQSDLQTIVINVIHLDGLTAIYSVLKQCLNFLNTYEPKAYGIKSNQPPFYGEVHSIAHVALMLTKDIDPALHSKIETEIKNYRWPYEQKNEYLKQYLELVLNKLSPVYQPED